MGEQLKDQRRFNRQPLEAIRDLKHSFGFLGLGGRLFAFS